MESKRLEAELQAEWSRATLERYGAALRAEGNPRGRMIEIDFALEATPRDRALLDEKEELQKQWLGELAVTTQFGFIESLQEEMAHLADALVVAAPWARTIDLWGGSADLTNLFERLGTLAWPWLATLEVRAFDETKTTKVPNAVLARLADAAPRLAKLSVSGHLVLDDFPHPGITRLIADGHDACGALRGTAVMPNVTRLDFALHPDFPIDREPPPEVLRAGLVDPAAFPQLRILDLTRNEPSAEPRSPNCLAGRTPLFDILPRFKCLAQLEELRVPSLRNAEQCAQLQAVLDRMPSLRVLDVPRMYNALPVPLRHPAQITIGTPAPWLANDALRDYDALVFFVDNQWKRVDFEEPYMLVESRYDKLSPVERAAWDELWRITRELDGDDQRKREIATPTLQTLLATFEEDTYGWWDLKTLVDAVTDPTILVRRIDGYEEPYTPAAPPVERAGADSERIREHEAALQAHWDLDRVAVYADDLQELGDVRGELIAFDLKHDGERMEYDYRRGKLHMECFGRDNVVRSKYGLAHVSISAWGDESRMQKILVGDVARYLRGVEISGSSEHVAIDLALVLAAPRPWLRSLRLEATGVIHVSGFTPADLVQLMPHLEELALATDTRGSVLHHFVHERVRRMWITGAAGLAGLSEPWPSVTELDFAFGAPPAHPERVLTRAKLPALRILDLSRNEPEVQSGWENHLRHKCSRENFTFWETIEATDRALFEGLTHLRLPSPRTPRHARALDALLARMPLLEHLEIVRRYPHPHHVDLALKHPRAKLVVPEPVSWLPADALPGTLNALDIEGIVMPLHPTVLAMELHHDHMPEDGRLAWDWFWAEARNFSQGMFELPATTLYAAAEALKSREAYAYDDWLDPLIAALHPLAIAEATVALARTERD